MRVMALVRRILKQIIRDKRTLVLLIMAPILVLTMLHLVFNGESYTTKVGFVDLPTPLVEQLDDDEATINLYETTDEAKTALKERDIDGYVNMSGTSLQLTLEGSDPTINGATMKWLQESLESIKPDSSATMLEVNYLHGSSEMSQFDSFGPVLLGFFIFFFVFLIAGVSFLRERTTGTLERLLCSPLRKWEIVVGYVIGFGIFTMIQATIIASYAIYVLGMMMEGAFIYVLFITLLLSLTALTLGVLLSAFANNELQMIQFIPLVIVPQIFFSGLFNLETISDYVSWVGPLTPLYYGANALRNVMIRGYGWGEISFDLLMLSGFSLLFMILNILALKKYRSI
ncbi:ABC transporter permease [Robertmurraya sp. P23]|uniref:ABC transporter permease n=1 Tax=Robertmurraya sp. P23 TaxID=3436931 RepID=UPI003D9668B6